MSSIIIVLNSYKPLWELSEIETWRAQFDKYTPDETQDEWMKKVVRQNPNLLEETRRSVDIEQFYGFIRLSTRMITTVDKEYRDAFTKVLFNCLPDTFKKLHNVIQNVI